MGTGIAPAALLDPGMGEQLRRRTLRRVVSAMLEITAERSDQAREDALRADLQSRFG